MPYQADARQHWFDDYAKRTAEAERLLTFVGWLMAQSAYNRSSLQVSVPLPLPLPLILTLTLPLPLPLPLTSPQVSVPVLLFRRLVEGPSFAPSLPLLAEFDAATAAGTPLALEPRTRPTPTPTQPQPQLNPNPNPNLLP